MSTWKNIVAEKAPQSAALNRIETVRDGGPFVLTSCRLPDGARFVFLFPTDSARQKTRKRWERRNEFGPDGTCPAGKSCTRNHFEDFLKEDAPAKLSQSLVSVEAHEHVNVP
jgi:hypothetical protein